MKDVIFTGSGVAIVTPFNESGIDFPKYAEILEWHIAHKTDAVVVCGTTGEASTMPDPEHKSAIKFAVDTVKGRIPVIAGTGSNDTPHAIELSTYAKEVGVDGILLVTPYYNKTTQKGLYEHYKAIAESVGDLPIILYNVPSRTGMQIAVDTLKKLDKIKNIVAIKEASGNISYLTHVAAEVDMAIYSGNDDMVIPAMSVGGLGVISVAANIVPEYVHDMCQLYLDGKCKEAAAMQLKALDMMNKLFIEVNPIPVKTAMNLMGMNVGKLRMPLCDMEEKNLETMKQAMIDFGIKL